MKVLLVAVAVVLALAGLLSAAGLLVNHPPLNTPPGAVKRLATYVSTNVAETRPDHPHAELRPLSLPGAPESVYPELIGVAERLGWTVAWTDAAKLQFEAVVQTRLLRFEDDVRVSVSPGAEGGSVVNVRSRSRIGKGDLGANTRHVMDFLAAAGALAAPAEGP